MKGLVLGLLTLTLLEAIVSTSKAASNTGAIFTLATGALSRIVDPTMPLIPDRRSKIQGEGGAPIILAN